MSLKADLQSIIRGDVLDDKTTLIKYSTDYSLLKVRPRIVIAPKDIEDIKTLVKYVSKNKKKNKSLSLTTRAAGTDMSGGPLNNSIIIDCTKYLNHISNIFRINKPSPLAPSPTFLVDGQASAEPGVYYRDFEAKTLEKGLIFPSYPASKSLCAIGGIVNNNSGGEKSLIYGKTEKYVREIKMVLRDANEYTFRPLTQNELEIKMTQENIEGQIYKDMFELIDTNYNLIQQAKPKVSKNSAGYALWNVYNKGTQTFDLTQLICGAQGTLGIMSQATLGLVTPKTHSALLAIFINDFTKLSSVINRVLKDSPETFESYDETTFNLAVKLLPKMIKEKGLLGMLSMGWRFLPELWISIKSLNIPDLVLIAEFTGDSEEEIYNKARKAQDDLRDLDVKTHIAKDDKEEDKYWMIRRDAFKILTDHSTGKRTAPFIDDVVVSPDKLSEFLPKLKEIMNQYDLIFTIQGHIGDGNFHIIPLIDIGDKKMKKIIPELEQKVFDLVFEYGGSITGEHNDGLIRSHYLPQMYGTKIYDLFVKTKKIWDPKNIFNPNKKIGTQENYVLRHLDLGKKKRNNNYSNYINKLNYGK